MPVTSGEMLVFAHPVTVAPAVAGRDGAVRAGGWLPDHVRLGELERHLGEGVIEDLVAAGIAAGRDDPQQPLPLFIIDLAHAYSFCHQDSLTVTRPQDRHPDGASRHNGANVA